MHNNVGWVSGVAAEPFSAPLLLCVPYDLPLQDKCATFKSQDACEEPRVRPKQVGKYKKAARAADAAVTEEAAAKCVT